MPTASTPGTDSDRRRTRTSICSSSGHRPISGHRRQNEKERVFGRRRRTNGSTYRPALHFAVSEAGGGTPGIRRSAYAEPVGVDPAAGLLGRRSLVLDAVRRGVCEAPGWRPSENSVADQQFEYVVLDGASAVALERARCSVWAAGGPLTAPAIGPRITRPARWFEGAGRFVS